MTAPRLSTVRSLTEVLDLIDAGWNVPYDVADRGVVMRDAMLAGLPGLAEDMADEVVLIQSAVNQRDGARAGEPSKDPTERWELDLETWANGLIGGGWLCNRDFSMPKGSSQDQARARARIIFAGVRDCTPTLMPERKQTFADWAA